jgi:putative ABC transport system permease protein
MKNGMRGGPPRLVRGLLRWVVPDGEADIVDGELREGFARRVESDGVGSARRWYRRQVWGFGLRAFAVHKSTGTEGETMGWTMGSMDEVARDVRWALRSLKRRPTFTAVAVATLALGIGANSAIFTLVSAHFLAPLPYDQSDDLVLLWETGRNDMEVRTVAPGNYWTWRAEASSFADIAAYNVDLATLSGEGTGAAESVTASVVVPHFFDVLGVTPALGSGFTAGAAREANEQLVILSNKLWTRRYAADPGIVGRDIRVDGRPHTVVGVMPASFRQPERSLSWQSTELWRPVLLESERDDHGSRYLRTIARLAPGVTVEQAREEMTPMAARLTEAFPEQNAGRSVLVRTLDEYLMGTSQATLLMLLFAGLAVLLIVCANVANLTLARGEERRREFAVRAALGSGSGRLIRQVAVEGVVLALAGAFVGTLVVFGGRDLLQSIQAEYFSGLVDVAVDWRIVAFTAAVAVASGVLFALPLARSAARPEIRSALIEGGHRSGGRRGSQMTRNVLIVGQVGVATTLLVVATLLSRSFNELINVAPGFQAGGVISFGVNPPRSSYPGMEDAVLYHQEVLAEVERIPGVTEVGMVSDLPFTTQNRSTTFRVTGLTYDPTNPPSSEFKVVIPEYFDVMAIRLESGTVPAMRDDAGTDVQVVVNARFAEAYWAGQDPIGASFQLEWNDTLNLSVAGVVGDILDDGFDAAPDPVFYLPYQQSPGRSMAFVVATAGDPTPLVARVRDAVARVDPDVPAADLMLLEDMMAETVTRPKAASLIGMAFALIALLVSAAGIYGVLSYAVQARTREIGIRAALGADGQHLVTMVMGQSTALVGLGLGIGLLGALVAGSALSGLLFGVRAWDPMSMIGATGVLATVATLAAWIPARRAVAIDPKEALRSD